MPQPVSCSRPTRDRWLRVMLSLLGIVLVASALLGYLTPWGYAGVSLLITAGLGH